MEKYSIASADGHVHEFDVAHYPYRDGDTCKYRAFSKSELVASFEPDPSGFLHLCLNPGKLDPELVDLLAEAIEAHHPGQLSQDE